MSLRAGLVIAALAALLPQTAAWERLELRTQDARLCLRGPRASAARPRILLALVTDRTLARWPEPTVFWGTHYARAVREASHLGAAGIGLDVVPAADTDSYLEDAGVPPDNRPNAALEAALEDAGDRAVLAYVRRPDGPPIRPWLSFQGIPTGFADLPDEPDDVARRAWDRDRGPAGILPSFEAMLAARLTGGVPPPRRVREAEAGSVFWINPLDDRGDSLHQISLEALAEGRLSPAQRAWVRGAVVLIGRGDSDSQDWFRAPGRGARVPGASVCAQAIATLADGRPLRRGTPTEEGFLAALLALAMAPAARRLPFGSGLAAALVACAFWWTLAQWALALDTLLPVAAPLLALALPWPAHHALRSRDEHRQRRQITDMFGRYVSPVVRDYLLADPRRQRPGGTAAHGTVLFLDIRDFTCYAQDRDPALVMAELNVLFARIAPAIARRGGLLHKFMGDGLLALFGVPLPLGGHAQAAVGAAGDILQAVRRVNAERAAGGLMPWRVGCGIHTGPLVCGSLGEAARAEFTVIGNTVNLAARLEGLTKELGGPVVVSRATVDALAERPTLGGPHATAIRGRPGLMEVFVWDGGWDGEPEHPGVATATPGAGEKAK